MQKLRGLLSKTKSRNKDDKNEKYYNQILNKNKQYDLVLLYLIRWNGLQQFHFENAINEIIKKYIFGVLIIEKNQTIKIKSDELNIFYDIIIDGTLTVEKEWNYNDKYGGYLNIYSLNNMLLNSSGHIDVNGMGYKGGGNLSQGESYNGLGKSNDKQPNFGGGGALRGGGGYGTKGENCQYGGIGGNIYGDQKLNILYRGSGGGGGHMIGGNGGGIIHIIVEKEFVLNGKIASNGMDGTGIRPGGGSGGSIKIEAKCIKMSESSCIMAKGGYLGGDGRIRINVQNKDKSVLKLSNCKPIPYMG